MGHWLAATVIAVCLALLLAPVEAYPRQPRDYSATMTAMRGSYLATRDAGRASFQATRQARLAENTATLTAAYTQLAATTEARVSELRAKFPTFTPVPTRVPRTTATIRAQVQARWQPTPRPELPGDALERAVPIGTTIQTPENWQITVLNVLPNYDQRIAAAGLTIKEPPPAGWQWVAFKLRLTNLGPVHPSSEEVYKQSRELPLWGPFLDVVGTSQLRPLSGHGCRRFFSVRGLPDDYSRADLYYPARERADSNPDWHRMPEAGFHEFGYSPLRKGMGIPARQFLFTGESDEGWWCVTVRNSDVDSLRLTHWGTVGGVERGWWRCWWKLTEDER